MSRCWRWLSIGAAVACTAVGTSSVLVGANPAGASTSTTHADSSKAVAGFHVAEAAITSLTGTVTVPKLSCPGSGSYSSDLSVQVVGQMAGGSFIRVACTAGVATYSAFVGFSAVNGTKTFAVAPGNTVETQITISVSGGSTTATAVVANESTGVTTTKIIKKAKVLVDTVGWDIFQHVGGAPVPPFTSTVEWTGATVNGMSFQAAAAQRYDMVDTKKVVLVSSSVLGATGSSFSNKFHAST